MIVRHALSLLKTMHNCFLIPFGLGGYAPNEQEGTALQYLILNAGLYLTMNDFVHELVYCSQWSKTRLFFLNLIWGMLNR